jgi:hypothetical protein
MTVPGGGAEQTRAAHRDATFAGAWPGRAQPVPGSANANTEEKR